MGSFTYLLHVACFYLSIMHNLYLFMRSGEFIIQVIQEPVPKHTRLWNWSCEVVISLSHGKRAKFIRCLPNPETHKLLPFWPLVLRVTSVMTDYPVDYCLWIHENLTKSCLYATFNTNVICIQPFEYTACSFICRCPGHLEIKFRS